MPAQSSGDNSQIYLVAGVSAAGLLIVVLLVTLLFSFQGNSTATVDSPRESVEPAAQSTSPVPKRQSYPATSFWTPPTPEDASKQVEAELARLRQNGEPITIDDLKGLHPRQPRADDTTGLWLNALSNLSAAGPTRGGSNYRIMVHALDLPLHTARESQEKDLSVVVDPVRTQLDPIIALGQNPGRCQFSFPFDKGAFTPLDDVSNAAYASRLLEARARLRTLRGDQQDLYETLIAMFALARTLDETVGMTAHLVRAAVFDHACRATADAIAEVDYSAEQIDKLAAAVSDFEIPKSAIRGLVDTRAFGLAQLEDGEGLLRTLERTDMVLPPKAPDRDRAFYLGFQAKLQDARRAEPWKTLEAIEKLNSDLKALAKLSPEIRDDYRFSLLLCPADSASVKSTVRIQASQRTTLAALRVRAFQIRTNRSPTNLAECGVVPSDAIDPINGKQLRYRVENDHLVIYSVGLDLRDNGGREVGFSKYESDYGVKLKHRGSK